MKQEEKLPTQVPSIRKNFVENKILPLLQYIGAIGASIMSVAYIVIVMVMIVGFKAQNFTQTLVFAIVNAVIGIIIMQLLKIQGISFAKNLPENKKIIKEYYNTQTKDKKLVSIDTYWWKSLIKDIVVKGFSVLFSTAGLIYIVIEGSNDYNLLLMAIVNLFMFVCFGLLALNSAYEFYNNRHIPYIIDQLEQANKPRLLAVELNTALKNMEANNNVYKKWSRMEKSTRTSSEE